MSKNARIIAGGLIAMVFVLATALVVSHLATKAKRADQVALYNAVAKRMKPAKNPHTDALIKAAEACTATGSYLPREEAYSEALEKTIKKSVAHTWPEHCAKLGARHDPRFPHMVAAATQENCDKLSACVKTIDAFEQVSVIRGVPSPLGPWHIQEGILDFQDTVNEYQHHAGLVLVRAHFQEQGGASGARLEAALDTAQLSFDMVRGTPLMNSHTIDTSWQTTQGLLRRRLADGDLSAAELDKIIAALSTVRANFPSFFDSVRAELLMVGAHVLDGEDITPPPSARGHFDALIDTRGIEGFFVQSWPERVFDALVEVLALEDNKGQPRWKALIAIDKPLNGGFNPIKLHTWNSFQDHMSRFENVRDSVAMFEAAAHVRRHALRTGRAPESLDAIEPPLDPEIRRSEICDKRLTLLARGDKHYLEGCIFDIVELKDLGAAR